MLNIKPVAAKLIRFLCAMEQILLSPTQKSLPPLSFSWQSPVSVTEARNVRFSYFCYNIITRNPRFLQD